MNAVRAKISLLGCGIDHLSLKCDHEGLDTTEQQLAVEISMRQHVKGSIAAGRAKVSLFCSLRIKGKDTRNQPLCEIDVEYFGNFGFGIVNREQSELEQGELEEISTLLSSNGTAIVFPYLRAAISSITTAAGIDPIVLPTVNVLALLDETESVVEIDR